jgi:hypothetical protein
MASYAEPDTERIELAGDGLTAEDEAPHRRAAGRIASTWLRRSRLVVRRR